MSFTPQQIVKCNTITALPTPLTRTNKVDFRSLGKLIEYQLESGAVDALLPIGTTGQYSTLKRSEETKMLKFVIDLVNGRLPIIAGANSNSTRETKEMIKLWEQLGINCVLNLTGYCNKPSQRGFIAHYEELINTTNALIVPYNVPGRSGVNMTPKTAEHIFNLSDKIIGWKECNLDQAEQMVEKLKKPAIQSGRPFALWSGNDLELPEGFDGWISVISAALPVAVKKLAMGYKSYRELDMPRIQEETINIITEELKPLYNVSFMDDGDGNPVSIQSLLHLMKIFATPNVNLPLVPPSAKNIELQRKFIKEQYPLLQYKYNGYKPKVK